MSVSRLKWVDGYNITEPSLFKNKDCVVVIPVYKTILTDFEVASLKQVCEVLGNGYNIFLVYPETLDISLYQNIVDFNFDLFKLPSAFFRSQRTYSDLCLTQEFYEAFKEFKYMCIYQLDAWIFEDNLKYFCDLDYDYIGAPHLWNGNSAKIGNGGLSLRKISALIKACENDFSKEILLEDRVLTEKINTLKIAPLNEALKFSWQDSPSKALSLNENKLPMGAHALLRFKSFWAKYLDVVSASLKPQIKRLSN